MNSTEISVRAATCEDAEIIAQAVAMAIGDETALLNYCGDDYLAVLTDVARLEVTQYGWRYALIAEIEGVAAGGVVIVVFEYVHPADIELGADVSQ